MDSMFFGNIDKILKSYGYEKVNSNDNFKYNIDPSAGADNNGCKNFDSDIPHGFQDVDPMLAVIFCEILSNITCKELPSNIASTYGNWLQLIAQVIVSFSAQQTYFESGPGQYFNPLYRNISNPFCTNDTSSKKTDKRTYEELNSEIKKLKKEVSELKKQISDLKKNNKS